MHQTALQILRQIAYLHLFSILAVLGHLILTRCKDCMWNALWCKFIKV